MTETDCNVCHDTGLVSDHRWTWDCENCDAPAVWPNAEVTA